VTDEIWRLDGSRTRSVSAENPTGAPGVGGRATEGTGAAAARELGLGWKVSPSIDIAAGETATLMDVAGPGVLRHLWLTTDRTVLRSMVLRIYWDGEAEPAVDLSLGEFFCNAWDELALLDSEMIVVAPAGGLNSYWPMPFPGSARMTLRNAGERTVPVYYQATYTETEVPETAGRLHIRSRRSNPLGDPAVHTILDGVRGHGRYVGTYLGIRPGAPGWWGEGEVKFYLDGDTEFPTICGTGTEDYFGGAWNFDVGGRYHRYTSPYLGLHQVLPPNDIYGADQRLGMYRWHVRDPICFDRELRVTVQALGWQEGTRYRPLTEADVTTTAFWYQAAAQQVG
jgi:hypothetical protein